MQDIEKYIDTAIKKHQLIAPTVAEILKNILKKEKIDYLSINYRVKDKQSSLEKIKRKSYNDPLNQITDFSGIRIIAYLENDIKNIKSILEKAFSIKEEHSSNKNELLSSNKIGYRSIHLVASLGKNRAELAEYSGIHNEVFEIQIRTVLQHAWAELSHDRNYKFKKKLPIEIERKLNLFAGLLEIADNGFCEISDAIDKYAQEITGKITENSEDIEIDSISLSEFFNIWLKENKLEPFIKSPNNESSFNDLILDLKNQNITTINKIKSLIPSDYSKKITEFKINIGFREVIISWLLISDLENTKKTEDRGWSYQPEEVEPEREILEKYYSPEEVEEILNFFISK